MSRCSEEGWGRRNDDPLEGSVVPRLGRGWDEPGPLTGIELHEWVEDLFNAGQLDRCRQH